MKQKSKFLFLEHPKYCTHLNSCSTRKHFALMPSHFITNHLFTQTNRFTKYMYLYKQPQYFGEELNQFRFACYTDYKHFQANEQQLLTTTSRFSILPIYRCSCCAICCCFQNIFSAYIFFNIVQSNTYILKKIVYIPAQTHTTKYLRKPNRRVFGWTKSSSQKTA